LELCKEHIQKGDLVALHLPIESATTIGEVTGDYQYREITPEIKYVRNVKWIAKFPGSDFDKDILFSFGAIQTVCRIKRKEAESRVRKMQTADKRKSGTLHEIKENTDIEIDEDYDIE